MTTVTFDTLKLVDKLKAAGIPQEQAEAVVRKISKDRGQFKIQIGFSNQFILRFRRI